MRIVSKQPSEVMARMAPLSVLPVFLDLHGKRAVIAGGGDGAGWKAELLAAAGAEVHVYAPADELSEEFSRLLAGSSGSWTHHDCGWSGEVLADAAVAIADAENEEKAAAFAHAARQAGVPCNVIDRPAFCTFQFGSIVNRSPVVVGISSSGAAPILAQAIRRRIETLLPQALAEWAALAQRLRAAVTERLKPGGERRAFWESLVDRAFGPAPAPGEEARLERAASRIAAAPAGSRGRITLVGAGPGDAELLTLKAVRALQAADVIFFGPDVSAEVLELARREAKRILVNGGNEGAEVIREMAALAITGKRVVHLKPGDAASSDHDVTRLRARGTLVEIVRGVAVDAKWPRPIRRAGHPEQTAESPSVRFMNVRKRYAPAIS